MRVVKYSVNWIDNDSVAWIAWLQNSWWIL